MGDKRYYWLKLDRNFFKRHDIRILSLIGTDAVLLYVKLMCESIDHEGRLRFSEALPYTKEMLSAITDTPLDVVEKTIDFLKNMEMIRYEDDGTITLPNVIDRIGCQSDTDEANRQRRCRERRKNDQSCDINVTSVTNDVTNRNESKSKNKSKNKSKITELEIEEESEEEEGVVELSPSDFKGYSSLTDREQSLVELFITTGESRETIQNWIRKRVTVE